MLPSNVSYRHLANLGNLGALEKPHMTTLADLHAGKDQDYLNKAFRDFPLIPVRIDDGSDLYNDLHDAGPEVYVAGIGMWVDEQREMEEYGEKFDQMAPIFVVPAHRKDIEHLARCDVGEEPEPLLYAVDIEADGEPVYAWTYHLGFHKVSDSLDEFLGALKDFDPSRIQALTDEKEDARHPMQRRNKDTQDPHPDLLDRFCQDTSDNMVKRLQMIWKYYVTAPRNITVIEDDFSTSTLQLGRNETHIYLGNLSCDTIELGQNGGLLVFGETRCRGFAMNRGAGIGLRDGLYAEDYVYMGAPDAIGGIGKSAELGLYIENISGTCMVENGRARMVLGLRLDFGETLQIETPHHIPSPRGDEFHDGALSLMFDVANWPEHDPALTLPAAEAEAKGIDMQAYRQHWGKFLQCCTYDAEKFYQLYLSGEPLLRFPEDFAEQHGFGESAFRPR